MTREFLQNFQVGGQTLPKEAIDAILDENSRDIGTAKSEHADYDTIKSQLAEAQKTIKGFQDQGTDIEALRKSAKDWEDKYNAAIQEHEQKMADMAFDHTLDSAITAANGRNGKAIRALLDLNALKGSKNQAEDIKTALDALKQEAGYMFDDGPTPPYYAPGTGSGALLGAVTKEAFAKMGYRERLELKQRSPKIYEQMKE